MGLPKCILKSRFEDYLRNVKRLAPQTVEAYLSDLNIWQTFLEKQPADLNPNLALSEFMKNLNANGSSARSIHRKLSSLKAYALAMDDEDLLMALENTDRPRFESTLPSPPSKAEMKKIVEDPAEEFLGLKLRSFVMVRLLYSAGLRVSELTSLLINQIDFDLRILRIRGKGNKFRLVPMDVETTKLLLHYLKQQPQTRPTAYVFSSPKGQPLTRQAVWKIIKKVALLTGLPPETSPHTLRHAFATHLLENNVNLRALQMLLGHSDLSTTQVYTHISREHLREVLNDCHPLAKTKR